MSKNLAIFASHNGSGMDAIIKAIQDGILDLKLTLLITNNSDSHAATKASKQGIPTFVINAKTVPNPEQAMQELLKKYACELVFLSGYMKKLPAQITTTHKVINAHPSLLPKFGGKGMYGRFVHEAVLASGEGESGVTIHRVNEAFDEGEIILQKSLFLTTNETPDSLETRIKALEAEAIVEALQICLK